MFEKANTIININKVAYCLLLYWHAALCLIERDNRKMIKIQSEFLIYFFVLKIF
jgi:hypothetical protein